MINIKKLKIDKHNRLVATYINEEGGKVTYEGAYPVHVDLLTNLVSLVPFLVDITEQKEAESINWQDPFGEVTTQKLKNLMVTGVNITGDEAEPKVVLIGRRVLASRKMVQINTPAIELEGSYPHTFYLQGRIDDLLEEATKYIVDKKYAVTQHEMDFDSEDPFAVDETEDVFVA